MKQEDVEICFTVIVVVYNNCHYIERCINSYKHQNYEYKELVIIDGGSTDGTVNILEKNNGEINYWESKPDRGIYHAFNKGVLKSSGQWIVFLGSDDYFYDSDVLSRVASTISSLNYKPLLIYGKVAMISARGELLEVVNKPWEKSKRDFFQFCNINHQGVFSHRSLFEDNGLFDESFKFAGDYEFLLRSIRCSNHHITFLDDIIITYRQISGTTTIPTNYIEICKEFYKARHKNNINTFPWKLFYGLLVAVIRIRLIKTIGEDNTNRIVDLYRQLTGRPQIWRKI